jgi:hypothetical protein
VPAARKLHAHVDRRARSDREPRGASATAVAGDSRRRTRPRQRRHARLIPHRSGPAARRLQRIAFAARLARR